jgi:hypothetical protein
VGAAVNGPLTPVANVANKPKNEASQRDVAETPSGCICVGEPGPSAAAARTLHGLLSAGARRWRHVADSMVVSGDSCVTWLQVFNSDGCGVNVFSLDPTLQRLAWGSGSLLLGMQGSQVQNLLGEANLTSTVGELRFLKPGPFRGSRLASSVLHGGLRRRPSPPQGIINAVQSVAASSA